MRLQYTCSACKQLNYYKSFFSTRGDLQMKEGDEIKLDCTKCGRADKKHINKIEAIVDLRLILLGVLLGLITTIILWNLYGAIGAISLAIPLLMWVQETKSTNSFNKYTIRRK